MPAWNSTRVIRFSRRERERERFWFEEMSGNSVHVDSIFRRTRIRILERIILGIIRRIWICHLTNAFSTRFQLSVCKNFKHDSTRPINSDTEYAKSVSTYSVLLLRYQHASVKDNALRPVIFGMLTSRWKRRCVTRH